MKGIFSICLLLLALNTTAQNHAIPLGGNSKGSVEAVGGMIADSGLQVPKVSITAPVNRNKGLDSFNARIVCNTGDSNLYMLRGGVYYKLTSTRDSSSVAGATNSYVFFAKGSKIGQDIHFEFDTTAKTVKVTNDTGKMMCFVRGRGDTSEMGVVTPAAGDQTGVKFSLANNGGGAYITFISSSGGLLRLSPSTGGYAGSSLLTFRVKGGQIAYTSDIQNVNINTVAYGSTNIVPFDSSQYDYEVTGGSGATTFTLPTGTNAAVGTPFIISDLGAACSSNNITIDAGTGNVIVAATSAQTYVMSTNGLVVRLKKVSATKWKLQ